LIQKTKSILVFSILVFFQAVHSLEEIISGFYNWFPFVSGKVHDIINFFPVLHMGSAAFIILNILLVFVLIIVTLFLSKGVKFFIKMSKIIAIIEIINGIAHISGAVIIHTYYPGSITAAGLIITSVYYLTETRKYPVKAI
jgi:hypothetical protein